MNVIYDGMHFGMAVQHDLDEFKTIEVQAAMGKPAKDGKFFAKVNVLDEEAGLGVTLNQKECKFAHSYLVQYLWGKDAKGLFGQPLRVTAGGRWNLKGGNRVLYSVEAAETW